MRTVFAPLLFTAGLLAGAAQASTLYTAGPTGALETNGSLSASFAAGGGAGQLDLQVQGYATLDGDNFYIDILEVSLNGAPIFSGTWDLGGGGIDRVLANPNGGTAVRDGAAHRVDISIPLTLLVGSNTLKVGYTSPSIFEGSSRSGFQGLGDEGWGLNNVSVTGTVPEPGTGAMLLAGLCAAAGFARHRRR